MRAFLLILSSLSNCKNALLRFTRGELRADVVGTLRDS